MMQGQTAWTAVAKRHGSPMRAMSFRDMAHIDTIMAVNAE